MGPQPVERRLSRRWPSGAAASSVTFIIQDFMWLEWQKGRE